MGADKKLVKELLIIGRKIVKMDLVIGEGGNISARTGNIVYIKKRGASMATAKGADYIPVNVSTGKPLGRNGIPSTEIPMHLACYGARKDIGAVVHTHPVFITALGLAAVRLERVSYEAKAHLKSGIVRLPYIKPGSKELGKAVGKAIRKHDAILLRKHGLLTVGKDIKEAFLRTLAVERAAMVYIYAFRVRP